ncbi:unnamed protein product [Lampetra fluviatilis]
MQLAPLFPGQFFIFPKQRVHPSPVRLASPLHRGNDLCNLRASLLTDVGGAEDVEGEEGDPVLFRHPLTMWPGWPHLKLAIMDLHAGRGPLGLSPLDFPLAWTLDERRTGPLRLPRHRLLRILQDPCTGSHPGPCCMLTCAWLQRATFRDDRSSSSRTGKETPNSWASDSSLSSARESTVVCSIRGYVV